ncbi:MAG: CBS domain-containing protein [Hyphomonadaceae bacterium]|nr:CBS domain-containing protein [Clostridia bacterium]
MKIKDVMTDQVIFVNPDTNVEQVAQLMQKYNVGSIPVCNADGVMGIVTDRDIVIRNVAHGTDPKTLKASDVMSTQVVTVSPSTDVRAVSKIMAEKQVRRLPVVDNNRIVGMVALGDLADSNGFFDMEASDALTEISKPNRI